MDSITCEQLKNKLESSELPELIDVRDPWEFEICHIDGSSHIPMDEITGKIEVLDKNRETVVICHHGMRSMQVVNYLVNMGFDNVLNLEGGIDAWAREIDPEMPQY